MWFHSLVLPYMFAKSKKTGKGLTRAMIGLARLFGNLLSGDRWVRKPKKKKKKSKSVPWWARWAI